MYLLINFFSKIKMKKFNKDHRYLIIFNNNVNSFLNRIKPNNMVKDPIICNQLSYLNKILVNKYIML